jgi:hypothetical protein
MRRILLIITGALTIATLSTAVAFASGGVSGVAKGHGQAVPAVGQAVTDLTGKARGQAVAALANAHGKTVMAAAKLLGPANAAAGKAKGAAAAAAQGSNATEPGGLKNPTSH